jgi:hypothetical protein
MESDRADLASVATALDELTRRVTSVADRYHGTAQDPLAVDLYEVERSLRAAGRQLTRVVRRMT